MPIRTSLLGLLLLVVAAPLQAQSRPTEQSPSMLLFPVDEVAPAGSLQMMMTRPKEGTAAVGAGATFGLLPRVRLVAQLAVGRPDPSAENLQQREGGWYAGAALLAVWTLAGDARSGLDLGVGVQVDHGNVDGATRTSAPAGLTARLTQTVGSVDLQPFVGGGVALRRDNLEAYRAWNSPAASDGAATAGWYAHGGVRVGSGRFWVQPSMTWSKVFGDGGFPPALVQDSQGLVADEPPVIERAPLLSIRAGFTP